MERRGGRRQIGGTKANLDGKREGETTNGELHGSLVKAMAGREVWKE